MELIPFSVTFFCCLLINIEYGILIGTGFHLLMLAYMENRPHPKVIRLPVKQRSIILISKIEVIELMNLITGY